MKNNETVAAASDVGRASRARQGDPERVALHLSASSACAAFVVVAVAMLGAQQQALGPPGDTAAVERGQAVLTEQCGFCHGANARGGSGGPDLTRSALVQEDENGKQLGELLRVGRPDRGMPKFDLPDAQVADVAAFLHAQIYLASNRRLYKILDVLVGDPVALQGRIVYPRRGGVPGSPAYEDKNAVKATITPSSSAAVTGAIVRLTDFEVTIFD